MSGPSNWMSGKWVGVQFLSGAFINVSNIDRTENESAVIYESKAGSKPLSYIVKNNENAILSVETSEEGLRDSELLCDLR